MFQLNEKFIQKERICSVHCFNICNCQHYVDIYRWIREGRRSISYGHDGYDDWGGNMTDGSMMMGDTGDNMSLPFNMGVLAMPMMCTTPNQLLGSLTGMMGGGMTGDDGNATQQMMMGLMQQQMMSGAGGMENMTEAELQHVMNMVICLPAMNEEMMQSMMGNGQNSTSSMMSGMMMQ
jgi:hypothetical protein